MVTIGIYVEGGGKGDNNSKRACRQGFGRFFHRLLGGDVQRVKIIACASRSEAYADFCRAAESRLHDIIYLLVDSEDCVEENCLKWNHVAKRRDDKWAKPHGASEERLHFMSACMEAWIISDLESFVDYYRRGLRRDQLFQDQKALETISKNDIERALKMATKDTSKGEYHKTRHGFDLLANTDPTKVRARCARFAAPFFDELTAAVKS